ncbi:hypothetical protein V8G54_008264 [Vigna mungo]|uniref:Uncharacterized protein n=1 Tax=Vigna mungo TaxID=3915 RepID=A0AAQ3S836_VIGMU
MDHASAYGNFSFPYNAQPPRFDMFYEPISEDILQPQGNPTSDLQGLTTQVTQLVANVNKLTRKVEEEKEAATNEAPLIASAALEFQEIKCPTTSAIVYSNPSLIDSHSTFNFDDDNSNSLMNDDCMSASVDISECVCEPYDHNYTVADFEKLVAGFSAQLSENVYCDGDESSEPHSEIDCTADVKTESIEFDVQIDFRKSKEYLKKMREAINHLLVLQYYEMDFYADVCEPEIDFTVFDHVHDVPVAVVDFNPCFDHSHITNVAFSIDRVHIHAFSVLDDCTDLNTLLDDELDAYDDRYAVFDDVKVDMADFENVCTDLGLELELEFAEFLNYVELGNEKLNGYTCLGGWL